VRLSSSFGWKAGPINPVIETHHKWRERGGGEVCTANEKLDI